MVLAFGQIYIAIHSNVQVSPLQRSSHTPRTDVVATEAYIKGPIPSLSLSFVKPRSESRYLSPVRFPGLDEFPVSAEGNSSNLEGPIA